MILRLEAEHYYIDQKEYGDLFMYNDDPDVYLSVKTLDDMKKVLDLIDKHGCSVTTFGYLNYMKGFRIDVRKKLSYDDKEEKDVIENDKESLIGVAILSTAGNVVDMLNIVRGDRHKVIEVIAKYFKEIVGREHIYWETKIPFNTFDKNDLSGSIEPTEKISSDESDYYVKMRKIEEGTFIPFTLSTPDWVTFNWTGEDMAYFYSILLSHRVVEYNEKENMD